MALMEWTENLELGVDRMDETHREFVAQLNALHAAPQDEFLPMLDAFIEHTVEHFAQEQRWMSEMEFPPMHCHLREHEGVLDIMREVRRMVSEGKTQVGPVLTRELAPWFENHARSMDATLAFFLRCHAAGVDPRQVLAAQAGHPCAHGAGHACGTAAAAGACEPMAAGEACGATGEDARACDAQAVPGCPAAAGHAHKSELA